MTTDIPSRTLGAFYPCYKNEKATRFVLENFRKIFPGSPIYLLSDGGDDFSHLAKEFNCAFIIDRQIGGTGEDSYYGTDRMLRCWERHKAAVEYCQTDYIMVLEDDVWVRGPIDAGSDFAIKGTFLGASFNQQSQQFILDAGGTLAKDAKYGLCGGAIYNSKAFLSIYEDVIIDIKNNHAHYFSESKQLGAGDCNITFHFAKRGYRFEQAEWLTEKQHNPEWDSGWPVVHGYKEHY